MTITIHKPTKAVTELPTVEDIPYGHAFIHDEELFIRQERAGSDPYEDVKCYSLSDPGRTQLHRGKRVTPVDLHVYIGDEPAGAVRNANAPGRVTQAAYDKLKRERDEVCDKYTDIWQALDMSELANHDDLMLMLSNRLDTVLLDAAIDLLKSTIKKERAKNRKLRKELRDG